MMTDRERKLKAASDRAYYLRNRDRIKASVKAYKENNKEKVAEAVRRWQADHKEQRYRYNAEYQRMNPEKRFNHLLMYHYGLRREEYDEMLKRQSGLCAICFGGPGPGRNRLVVDHRHGTDRATRRERVRELLCHRCNAAIGLALENQSTLGRMIEYLAKHSPKQ